MSSPFKFLDYFDKSDKKSFFGREAETDRLYKLVKFHRLSLVYGPSGAGKTSLIHCGLANRFHVTEWLPIQVKRGQDINESLFVSLKAFIKEDHELYADSIDPVKLLKEVNLQRFRPVYLIFDQLEELYIEGTLKERTRFTNLIAQIIDAGLPCRIIFILREEYLGRLYEFEQVVPIYYEQRLRVEPITAPVVKGEVIKKSFAEFKIRLSEPGLVDQMLKNLSGLKQVIPLPYLQVYLDRLWHKADEARDTKEGPWVITPKMVSDLGTLDKVFADYLREQQTQIQGRLQAGFPDCLEDFVRNLLNGLVTPEGTKRGVGISRNGAGFTVNAPLPAGWGEVPMRLLEKGLEALEEARLLRREETSIELAHDALAAVIDEQRSAEDRELNKYRRQIKDGLDTYSGQKDGYLSRSVVNFSIENLSALRLSAEQLTFLKKSEDYWNAVDNRELVKEREKRRRAVLFSVVAVVLMVVAVVLMVVAFVATGSANREYDRAERAASSAIDAKNEALASAKRDSTSRVVAENKTKEATEANNQKDSINSKLNLELEKSKELEGTLGGSYDQLIEQGEKEFEAWRLENALAYWSVARFLRPSEKRVQELVSLVEQSVEITALANSGNWDESEKLLYVLDTLDITRDLTVVNWYQSLISKSRDNWNRVIEENSKGDKKLFFVDGDIISFPQGFFSKMRSNQISIWSNEFMSSIHSLNEIDSLNRLTFSRMRNLESIEGLHEISNIDTLIISGAPRLLDLSPISSLGSLKLLYLDRIGEVPSEDNYSFVDRPDISFFDARKVVDLKHLETLTSLQSLFLSNMAGVKDLKSLKSLDSLTHLELINLSKVKSLVGIEELYSLTRLNTSGMNSVVDLWPLKELYSLAYLDIRGMSSIKNLAALQSLTSLDTLKIGEFLDERTLGMGAVSILSPLSHLNGLLYLDLSGLSGVSDIEPLNGMDSLIYLNLSRMPRIKSLYPLERLISLKTLILDDNDDISDISSLRHLDSLERLDLESLDNIIDISPLYKLKNLKKLSLYGTKTLPGQVDSLEGLNENNLKVIR